MCEIRLTESCGVCSPASVGAVHVKPGSWWTDQEKADVFEWLMLAQNLNPLVRFAFGSLMRVLHPHGKGHDMVLEMAKEVVQDKIKDAFRYLDTFRPSEYRGKKCPFMNWLYTMLARAAMRIAGKEVRGIIGEQQLLERRQGQAIQVLIPASRGAQITWQEAKSFLDRLEGKYREAIVLCIKEGLTREEAGKRSECPCSEGAMKVRLFRAVQKISRLMKEGGVL